jgi:hypothetical protein
MSGKNQLNQQKKKKKTTKPMIENKEIISSVLNIIFSLSFLLLFFPSHILFHDMSLYFFTLFFPVRHPAWAHVSGSPSVRAKSPAVVVVNALAASGVPGQLPVVAAGHTADLVLGRPCPFHGTLLLAADRILWRGVANRGGEATPKESISGFLSGSAALKRVGSGQSTGFDTGDCLKNDSAQIRISDLIEMHAVYCTVFPQLSDNIRSRTAIAASRYPQQSANSIENKKVFQSHSEQSFLE